MDMREALNAVWKDDGEPRTAMACKRCGAFSSARVCRNCERDMFDAALKLACGLMTCPRCGGTGSVVASE